MKLALQINYYGAQYPDWKTVMQDTPLTNEDRGFAPYRIYCDLEETELDLLNDQLLQNMKTACESIFPKLNFICQSKENKIIITFQRQANEYQDVGTSIIVSMLSKGIERLEKKLLASVHPSVSDAQSMKFFNSTSQETTKSASPIFVIVQGTADCGLLFHHVINEYCQKYNVTIVESTFCNTDSHPLIRKLQFPNEQSLTQFKYALAREQLVHEGKIIFQHVQAQESAENEQRPTI